MIKIGIIGEDPNDTNSISNLLKKKYAGVRFKKLIKNTRGFYLDNPKTIRSIKFEYSQQNIKYVIVIRDLDSLESDTSKTKVLMNWFKTVNEVINGYGVFLLNIFELEALIFADILNFNKIYNTSFKQNRNPMFINNPKELLIEKSRSVNNKNHYCESKAPTLFEHLDFNTVRANCRYFDEFISEAENKIGIK